eukprot:5374353-Karenia_brevis.AAC.1
MRYSARIVKDLHTCWRASWAGKPSNKHALARPRDSAATFSSTCQSHNIRYVPVRCPVEKIHPPRLLAC